MAIATFAFFAMVHPAWEMGRPSWKKGDPVRRGGVNPALFSGMLMFVIFPFVALSTSLLVFRCNRAAEIFQRPSQEEVKLELGQIATQEISKDDIQQMQHVQEQLKTALGNIDKAIQNAENIGDLARKEELEKKKTTIASALDDVARLSASIEKHS